MAVTELVAFTPGDRADSADQAIEQGEFHTIIPIFKGQSGIVQVKVKNSDDTYQVVGNMRSNPRKLSKWQLRGPVEYKVSVKNAGADLDDGT